MMRFDERDWPILRCYVSGEASDEEFDAYLAQCERNLRRGERYAFVVITAPDTPMTKGRHARLQADFIKRHRELIARQIAGQAFVLPSAVMRGVLRAILSMTTMPTPFAICATEAEAVEWARGELGLRSAG
jgi:hypothetical protein